MDTIDPNLQNVQVPSSPLQEWYEPFTEFIFKYQYFKTVKSDITLNLSEKNYLQKVFPNWRKQYYQLDIKQHKRKKQLKDIDNYVDEFFFMTKVKGTELLSFISHVRNAIAHGNVNFNGLYVEIRSYGYNPQTHRFSKTVVAYCKIKKDHFKDFFKELIK